MCLFKSLHKRTNNHLTRKVKWYWKGTINLQSGIQPTDTFQNPFLLDERGQGAESAHWGRGDVLPFQNLFRETGSVEYVAWSWITKSIIVYQVSCGLYGHRTSRSWFIPTWKTVCIQEPPTHSTGAEACYVGWN